MLELAADLLPRLRAGEPVALVTVTRVARSAPRGAGASMAVTARGEVIGSISGGCVESDAVVLAHAVLADGVARAARFGFSDETAHAAGLACGGTVDVLAYRLEPEDTISRTALDASLADERVSIAIAARGERQGMILDLGTLTALAPEVAAEMDAAAVLAETRPIADGSWLVLSRAPRARLIIAGAGEHAAALCRVGAAAGFAVTICDPWPLLATRERFPDAAEIVIDTPAEHLDSLTATPDATDARTAVCVLTHDERLDIPALHAALGMNVGFVGAMGARSTVAHRLNALRARGVDEGDLARLHSPLGLDLGGASPEEAAVAAIAEILAARHGATGRPLRDLAGPIHARTPADIACALPAAPHTPATPATPASA
jgi:xanthine dehydrogenase accessory factor